MAWLRRKWPVLAVGGAALGLTIVALSGTGHAAARFCDRNGSRRLSMRQARALARKWGRKRGIPSAWILATMFVESGRDACKAGDWVRPAVGPPYPRSLGLMQVNTSAHMADLERLGFERWDMFDPDDNVAVGSWVLAKRYRQILGALGGRKPPAPMGVLVQLAYKGPAKVLSALKRGEDPRYVYGGAVLARRSNALVEAEALV